MAATLTLDKGLGFLNPGASDVEQIAVGLSVEDDDTYSFRALQLERSFSRAAWHSHANSNDNALPTFNRSDGARTFPNQAPLCFVSSLDAPGSRWASGEREARVRISIRVCRRGDAHPGVSRCSTVRTRDGWPTSRCSRVCCDPSGIGDYPIHSIDTRGPACYQIQRLFEGAKRTRTEPADSQRTASARTQPPPHETTPVQCATLPADTRAPQNVHGAELGSCFE
jgi:hypothetical protein